MSLKSDKKKELLDDLGLDDPEDEIQNGDQSD